jgi:hypothetical protein
MRSACGANTALPSGISGKAAGYGREQPVRLGAEGSVKFSAEAWDAILATKSGFATGAILTVDGGRLIA